MVMPRRPDQKKEKNSRGKWINIKKLVGSSGASAIDLFLVAVVSVILTTFTMRFLVNQPTTGSDFRSVSTYNRSQIYTTKRINNNEIEYNLLLVSDPDHDSKISDKLWRSLAKFGTLRLNVDKKKVSIDFTTGAELFLHTDISGGGRAMELSDLEVYDGRLLSVDDRTGIVYEIRNNKAYPWLFLIDGPGNETKGMKAEWLASKNGLLYIGGLGKEWTTTEGDYVNDNPFWVKTVSPSGEVNHISWRDVFIKVRRSAGIEYPGYMIHEAVKWSDTHQKWFFLPRRMSDEKYSEAKDETRGTNLLIICDEQFSNCKVVHVGKLDHPARGFSAFQFIPETNDNLIVALKTEEKDGKAVNSYVTVFDVNGNIILQDSPLNLPYKFEGIAFI
ncbi:Apyrase [Dictyocaulus viviparus]|uniref:Apyrase n=1 Tax=Dictyocaulus viviparus TaxID=29172 RepID=A0A0D8XBZ3_DICVI|nr:Apyrase [Dictyocaulus viviparus]